ncbi:MAG: hypothetical protein ACLQVX_08865 [Limisphaerales bacterium]
MTDEKCEQLRHELEALLREYNFPWVIAAIEEEARLGKTEAQVVEAVKEDRLVLSDLSDLYELYVFSLVVDAAQEEGAQVYFRDVHGNSPSGLVFRTGPGDIALCNEPGPGFGNEAVGQAQEEVGA